MKNFGPLSNTFHRLKRYDKFFGTYTIYDFHTATNGYMWMQKHEGVRLNDLNERVGDCYHHNMRRIYSKDEGNSIFLDLLAKGFVRAGIFEQDILGYERRA